MRSVAGAQRWAAACQTVVAGGSWRQQRPTAAAGGGWCCRRGDLDNAGTRAHQQNPHACALAGRQGDNPGSGELAAVVVTWLPPWSGGVLLTAAAYRHLPALAPPCFGPCAGAGEAQHAPSAAGWSESYLHKAGDAKLTALLDRTSKASPLMKCTADLHIFKLKADDLERVNDGAKANRSTLGPLLSGTAHRMPCR